MGRLRFAGLLAWLAWFLVHVLFLIGFCNRLVVLFNWWSHFTCQRGARLITSGHLEAGLPTEAAEQPPVLPPPQPVLPPLPRREQIAGDGRHGQPGR